MQFPFLLAYVNTQCWLVNKAVVHVCSGSSISDGMNLSEILMSAIYV